MTSVLSVGHRSRNEMLAMAKEAKENHNLPVSEASEPLEAIAIVLTYLLQEKRK